MYHKTLNHHTGGLYVIKNDLFPYHHAYCPLPWGSRLWSYPVLCIIHSSGYIFNPMHITQKAL